jgi:hypothetical protein
MWLTVRRPGAPNEMPAPAQFACTLQGEAGEPSKYVVLRESERGDGEMEGFNVASRTTEFSLRRPQATATQQPGPRPGECVRE